ncbi:MAG: flavodoxin family protein [Clostridia bacterium]|nr:flavodoxin family protein [Clostridia bacterium]
MEKNLYADTANTEQSLKNKNVLVVFGSPHKDGYTAELMKAFISGLPGGVHIDIVSAFKSKILPCIDCGLCKKKLGCAFEDFDDFDKKFQSADILVIATPVYNMSVPAPLKNILDRTQQYYNARFHLSTRAVKKHKKAVLLVTSGSKEQDGAMYIKKMLKRMFTVMNTELCGKVYLFGTDRCDEDDLKEALNSARREALSIFS